MSKKGILIDGSSMPNRAKEYSWHELAVMLLGYTSLAGVFLLALQVFVVVVVLIVGATATVLTLSASRIYRLPAISKPGFLPIAVGFVALVFRFEQWPNLAGGQDQGMYTNMSEAIQRSGSLGFVDHFRQGLSEPLQRAYDRTDLLSLNLVDPATSTFQVEFYPLHPIWMSIGDFFLDGYGRHLPLLGFTFLGLVGGYFLAIEVDGRKKVAYLFTGFLAVNPALVFFAKFPVAETLAMAFMINGFLFVARYLNGGRTTRFRPLLLASLCFLSLSFVRWQVLLYLPAIFLVVVLCLVPVLLPATRRRLSHVVCVVLGSFGISLCYYAWRQPILAENLGTAVAAEVLQPVLLAVAFVLLTMFLFGIWRWQRKVPERMSYEIARLKAALTRYAPFFLLLAFGLSIWSTVTLYHGGVLYPWGDSVTSGDPLIFRYHAMYRLMLFLSPFGFLAILAAPYLLRRTVRSGLLCGLFTILWVVALIRPYVPYLYYYGRYLVVDLLPLALLLVAMSIAGLKDRGFPILARFAVAGVLGWSLFFSFVQIGHTEGEPNQAFEHILENVDDEDILVLPELDQRLVVPLRVTYQSSVFVLDGLVEPVSAIEELRELAEARRGRLVFLARDVYQNLQMRPFASESFNDCFLTNTDHYRDQRHLGSSIGLARLLLPTSSRCNQNTYEFRDITQTIEDTESTGVTVSAAFEAGFFDLLGENPVVQVGLMDTIVGAFDHLERGRFGVEVIDHLPADFETCEDTYICSKSGSVIYALRAIRRPTGTSLFVAPVVQDLGHYGNLLVSLDGAFVFGPTKETPECDIAGMGISKSIGSNWILRSCSGLPALTSTWVSWLSDGCIDEISSWYACAGRESEDL